MVPDLGMDYLVEVSTDQYYGPTTLGAVREFLLIGEINAETEREAAAQAGHPGAQQSAAEVAQGPASPSANRSSS